MRKNNKLCSLLVLLVFLLSGLYFQHFSYAEENSEKLNVAVVGGANNTVVLKSDGTVWTWGDNSKGQLGSSSVSYSITPLQVKELSEVKAIAAGLYHSVALKRDGTVWTWGYNVCGQLGDGTKVDKSSPVQVKGLSDVTAISAGIYNTVALKSDGTVWVWGYNSLGKWYCRDIPSSYHNETEGKAQLTWNVNTKDINDSSTIPVQVKGIENVQDISAGDNFIIALCKDGTVWAWGDNLFGQLGDNKSPGRMVPEKIKDFNGITAISAAGGHCIALKSDGTVWTWGSNVNYYNSLKFTSVHSWGDLPQLSSVSASKAPLQVGGLSDVEAVAAGNNHYIALKKDGSVWTWGNGDMGQLGDGIYLKKGEYDLIKNEIKTKLEHNVKVYPQQVKDVGNIIYVSTGENVSYAIKNDGTLWDWGDSYSSKLGNPRSVNNNNPGQVLELNLIVSTPTATSTPTPAATPTPTPGIEIILQIDNPIMKTWGIDKELDPGRGTKPMIVNNRTLLPIRALVEALGGTVDWNDSEKKVTVNLGQNNIELWIDSKDTKINGEQKSIEVAPQIINGRTMIPLRYVIENIGYKVQWNADDKTIVIN